MSPTGWSPLRNPIRMLEAMIASVPLPEGIVWLAPDDDRIHLAHRPPDVVVHAWLIKPPTDLNGKISVSKRITISIAEATLEHAPAVIARAVAAIEEFQQALRDGVEDRIDDCGDLP